MLRRRLALPTLICVLPFALVACGEKTQTDPRTEAPLARVAIALAAGPFALNIFGPFNGWFATVTGVTGVAVDWQGNLFAADFYNHRIQKFSADGSFLTSFGSRGDGPGQLEYAIAAAVADDGTLFAVDFGNGRIHKWRPAAP